MVEYVCMLLEEEINDVTNFDKLGTVEGGRGTNLRRQY